MKSSVRDCRPSPGASRWNRMCETARVMIHRPLEMVALNCRLTETDPVLIESFYNAGDLEWRAGPAPLLWILRGDLVGFDLGQGPLENRTGRDASLKPIWAAIRRLLRLPRRLST